MKSSMLLRISRNKFKDHIPFKWQNKVRKRYKIERKPSNLVVADKTVKHDLKDNSDLSWFRRIKADFGANSGKIVMF